MLRRKLATLVAGGAVGLVSLVGAATPAGAASTATGTNTPVVAAAPTGSTQAVLLSWYLHSNDWEFLWQCKEAGEQLIAMGWYTNYSCQYRHGFYELWVYPGPSLS